MEKRIAHMYRCGNRTLLSQIEASWFWSARREGHMIRTATKEEEPMTETAALDFYSFKEEPTTEPKAF